MDPPGGNIFYNTGPRFPVNWNPRYSIAAGMAANSDHRENYKVLKVGSRFPATALGGNQADYYVNPDDAPDGFVINGTLPVTTPQGVHSLTDVPVFAMGPCSEKFGGTYNNIEIFYKFADCFGLAQPKDYRN
jgi:alkaline phosphatase